MNAGETPIEVRPHEAGERETWQDFLGRSDNGCLYHDLDFLDYHEPGRFPFEHLLLRQGGEMLALVPGGPVATEAGTVYASPLGASFGGPVLHAGLRTSQGLALVEALQAYAVSRGHCGLDLTLGPSVFAATPCETLPFALFGRGFRLAHRWLCAMLDLKAAKAPRYETLFHKRQAGLVRACRRKGMTLGEYGPEGLPLFLKPFEDTYARHGVPATHTPQEIDWLLRRLPDRVRLFLAMRDGRCAMGVLLFMLRPDVGSTFYICSDAAMSREDGGYFLFAALADLLAERGVRWLDLGPCSWDGNFNAGVTFFKERLGCVKHCRDRWSWRANWTDAPRLAGMSFMHKE